jgi:hypothetical protein
MAFFTAVKDEHRGKVKLTCPLAGVRAVFDCSWSRPNYKSTEHFQVI